MPPVQGIPLQQSGLPLQICPYCEHTGGAASGGGGAASLVVASGGGGDASEVTPPSAGGVTPPSEGGGVTTPHFPWMLPWPTMQLVPGQQSPVMVQFPPGCTHAVPPSGT